MSAETPDTSPPESTTPEVDLGDLPYMDAVGELEQILNRIEVADVDVDSLTVDVARAAALLEHCRSRIHRAETQIHDVLAELDADDDEGSAKSTAATADS